MATSDFDCIVVGARCAGAPLAAHLARAGLRVLLLDAAKLPGDQPMSTHVVQTRGMDYLDALGVGDRVRALAPPLVVLRMQLGDLVHDVRALDGRSARCVRRTVLDPILQEAAASAGAVVRDASPVSGLLRDGDRVTGVEVRRNGNVERITARIVVGADGRNSTVARLAGAEEYFGYDNTRGGYWAYWPAPAIWRTASPYSDFDFYLGFDREDLRFIFHTDGDLLLIGTTPPVDRMRTWSRNFEASYLNDLAQNPITGPLVENSKPVGRILGLRKGRFGFKNAVGPGWALVGDAGLHKDPTPGNGITDALRDARSLADAIIDGSDRAFARYWRKRDVDSFELFRQAEDMGTPGFVNPLNSLIWKNMNDPVVAHRLSLSMDRRISPYDVISVSKMLKWMTKAVLRGNFDVVKPFLDAGKRGGEIRREFDARKKMLEAVS